MPNAGKSTLLSVTSNATPEIANYPFTTIKPNLGVVTVDKDNSLLIADIPGLIEGAADGKGLGDEFLRHVERTAVLMHMIDAYQPDVAEAYRVIQQELKAYKIDLSGKPQVVVLTKIEALDKEIVEDLLKQLKKVIPKGTPLFAISAQTHQGLKELLHATNILVTQERARVLELEAAGEAPTQGLPVLKLSDDNLAWSIEQVGQGRFIITGRKIEKFAARTDFNDEHGVGRIRDIMKKMGIMHALIRKRINPGDTIQIATYGSFEY